MALARYLVGVSAIAREVHLPPPNFSNTHTHTHTHTEQWDELPAELRSLAHHAPPPKKKKIGREMQTSAPDSIEC